MLVLKACDFLGGGGQRQEELYESQRDIKLGLVRNCIFWCRSPSRQQRACDPFPGYQSPLPPYPIRWDYFLPCVIRHQRLEAHPLSALRILTMTLRIYPPTPDSSRQARPPLSPFLASVQAFFTNLEKDRNFKFKLWCSQWLRSNPEHGLFRVTKEALRIRQAPGLLPQSSSGAMVRDAKEINT